MECEISPVKEQKRKKDADNATLLCEQLNLSNLDNKIDPKCILEIKRRLVRIEYPGEVKNVDKAIETLGGIEDIEQAVAERGRRLELNFHPRNKYNKPCFGDKDFKPGILIKVKKSSAAEKPPSLEQEDNNFEYEVKGVSVMNFSFNRLCDFQYLPLAAEQPESKESKCEYIYEKIIPSELPNAEWLIKEESKNMEPFILPVSFSQYDNAHVKLNVDAEKNEANIKLKSVQAKPNSKQQKNICRIFGKNRQQTSIFAYFKDKEVPTKPLDNAIKLIESRALSEQIGRVKQLFEERPIWTKAAIQYNTGLTIEQAKVVLPAVAYFFVNGPWRISWVKFGYDPRTDPDARIYQTLDYRIRTAESTKLKVTAKRSYTSKKSILVGPAPIKKVSLRDDVSIKPKTDLDERCYVLRPLTIPPARQMFYQLCDLILPEIQDRISALPKSTTTQCHVKHGWLQPSFLEDCRHAVNKHVLITVQKALLEDKNTQEKSKEKVTKKEPVSSMDYCNQMLSNIKKGIYKNVAPVAKASSSKDPDELNMESINLSSDEDDEYTFGEIIQNAIPENLEEDDEDDSENDNHSSDEAEIDLEVAEEIKQMLSQSHVKM